MKPLVLIFSRELILQMEDHTYTVVFYQGESSGLEILCGRNSLLS